MTEEGRTKLLKAYRMAVKSGQSAIADVLEEIIANEMEGTRMTLDRSAVNDPWDVTPLSQNGTWCFTRQPKE